MAYELENIETKIAENISSAASENLEFDAPMFLEELDVECSKVKRAFRHQVVSFENERLVKRYFHFHQESLIELIDTLHAGTLRNNSVRESILNRLAGLLKYLEEHFPDYFNQDMKMPVIYKQTIRVELQEFVSVLSKKFVRTLTDNGLVELLKHSLDTYINEREALTFRQFYYLKLLRLNIEGLDTSLESGFGTIDLIKVLMHCNFNTESFYNYILKYVSCCVEGVASMGEKLDQLMFYLKFANQECSNQAVSFNHHHAPISTQVAEWLSQEVTYLKNKQQLLSTITAEEIVPSEFKLYFDLSVSHLALLFRAFTETGVIQNKNASELIRFLTKYAKTKRSESISFESLRIKYYSVENGTKDAVKKMLQTVLNYINKN